MKGERQTQSGGGGVRNLRTLEEQIIVGSDDDTVTHLFLSLSLADESRYEKKKEFVVVTTTRF